MRLFALKTSPFDLHLPPKLKNSWFLIQVSSAITRQWGSWLALVSPIRDWKLECFFSLHNACIHLSRVFVLDWTSITPEGGVWGTVVLTGPVMKSSGLILFIPSHWTSALDGIKECKISFQAKWTKWEKTRTKYEQLLRGYVLSSTCP